MWCMYLYAVWTIFFSSSFFHHLFTSHKNSTHKMVNRKKWCILRCMLSFKNEFIAFLFVHFVCSLHTHFIAFHSCAGFMHWLLSLWLAITSASSHVHDAKHSASFHVRVCLCVEMLHVVSQIKCTENVNRHEHKTKKTTRQFITKL